MAEQLVGAGAVAVARPFGAGRYEVARVLKGAGVEAGQVVRGKGGAAEAGVEPRAALLSRVSPAEGWSDHGPFSPHLATFVRTVLERESLRLETGDGAAWEALLTEFAPWLGHGDARLGASAWRVWAGAPYEVLARHPGGPPVGDLRLWAADELRPGEDDLWWTLIGFRGDAGDAGEIGRRLAAAWDENGTRSLAALLAATLELGGPDKVAWVRDRYLLDRGRTLDEIEAALLALGVKVPGAGEGWRAALLEAYRVFLRERRPLGGLVARELSALGDWGAEAHFRELLESGEPVLPSTLRAIGDYLDACERRRGEPGSAPPR